MVQRYGTSSMPVENGVYVRHSDYEALEAEMKALRADAARFRWLNSQRENVWHEFASMPMNRTCEVIDEEIAKDQA